MSGFVGRILSVVLSVVAITAVSSDGWAQKKKAAARGGAGSATLDRALKLYDSNEHHSASIELYKVIEGETGDSDPNKQKAEFWMGKALYKMGFYSAALTYFDRIVQKGPQHAHYNETLKWLASLSREVPDSSGILDKIGKYDRKELEQPALESVRDELYFLLGKYHYNKGKFKEAVELFRMVPRTSPYYVQAKLFEGATHVREYNADPARDAFIEVLRVGKETDDPKVKPYEDLANLSLARIYYSKGGYELSAKYYDRVSTDSYDWPNSLFEASWANFMLRNAGYSKALGNIQSLQAPYFDNFVKPESVAEALTVKATIYFYNCQYDRAADAITEFREIYEPLALELKKVVDSTTANDAFYDLAEKIRSGESKLSKNVEQAARAVLSDRMLGRRFDYVKELDRELSEHEKADPAWKSTAVANAVMTDITLQRSLTVNEAGDLARQRLSRLVGELAALIKRVIKIEIEILQGEKGQLEQEIVQEQQIAGSGKNVDVSRIVVDDEHQYWPFKGEYWRDELGYYRVKLNNRCERTAPEGAPTSPTQ
jgi:tetratricopeptide (TPR) repeat protein